MSLLELFSKKGMEKFSAWLTEHDKSCRYSKIENQGASGGRLTYCFTPTSLGMVVVVECACGGKIDATDYELW